jgi:hypothetical protein
MVVIVDYFLNNLRTTGFKAVGRVPVLHTETRLETRGVGYQSSHALARALPARRAIRMGIGGTFTHA